MNELETLKTAIRDVADVVGQLVLWRGMVSHNELDLRRKLSRAVRSLDAPRVAETTDAPGIVRDQGHLGTIEEKEGAA